MSAVLAVGHELFTGDIPWSHSWAVEITGWKHDFILEHARPKHVFSDAIQLSNDGWHGKTHGGSHQSLTPVDIFTAGFECDTVSKLNVGRCFCY